MSIQAVVLEKAKDQLDGETKYKSWITFGAGIFMMGWAVIFLILALALANHDQWRPWLAAAFLFSLVAVLCLAFEAGKPYAPQFSNESTGPK